MIDIATTRSMALQLHPPRIIFALLFGMGLICSLLAGFRMSSGQHRSWLHILGFTVLMVIIVYVMLDVEYPPRGLDPPRIRRPVAGQSPRAYEVTVSDDLEFSLGAEDIVLHFQAFMDKAQTQTARLEILPMRVCRLSI